MKLTWALARQDLRGWSSETRVKKKNSTYNTVHDEELYDLKPAAGPTTLQSNHR